MYYIAILPKHSAMYLSIFYNYFHFYIHAEAFYSEDANRI